MSNLKPMCCVNFDETEIYILRCKIKGLTLDEIAHNASAKFSRNITRERARQILQMIYRRLDGNTTD